MCTDTGVGWLASSNERLTYLNGTVFRITCNYNANSIGEAVGPS